MNALKPLQIFIKKPWPLDVIINNINILIYKTKTFRSYE